MKSSTLLATMLLSKKIPSLLLFSVLPCKTEWDKLEFVCTCLEERILIFIFLQSNEYRANVPPAHDQLLAVMRVYFSSNYFMFILADQGPSWSNRAIKSLGNYVWKKHNSCIGTLKVKEIKVQKII
jgi:hypothetical protein